MSLRYSWVTSLPLVGTLLILGCTSTPHTTASSPMQGEVSTHRPTYLEGTISATTADFFTIIGLPKILVQVDSRTTFQTKEGTPLTGLNDLATNERVRVHGHMIDRNRFLATRIQVSSADSDASLESLCPRCPSQV